MKLPSKLSKLIEIALTDLELCERDPKYKIDMFDWHVPNGNVCNVCFAGAVMAKSFNSDFTENYTEEDFKAENESKFIALNAIRTGLLRQALINLNLCDNVDELITQFNSLGLHNVEDYKYNPTEFKLQLTTIAGFLAAEGY